MQSPVRNGSFPSTTMTMDTRAIVLSGTFVRHQFVITSLVESMDVVGVWQETKPFEPLQYAETDADRAVIEEHFAERNASEALYFGDHSQLRLKPQTVLRRLAPGKINDPKEVDRMRALRPDVVLVFGTGILKKEIIDSFAGNIINIHLGLSPYYRGSGTNFWPLVNREPEYVGATIHYLDAGIDTGAIIAHVRPEIEVGDGPHDIGNKAIQRAAEMLKAAAFAHLNGRPKAVAQTSRGRLYQRKEFSADAVRRLRGHFASGMIDEYLNHKADRDSKLELIELATHS